MMKRLKKIMAMGMVCSMVVLSAMPVNAKTCSYQLDQTVTIWGSMNLEAGSIYGNPGKYNAYALGSNAVTANEIAKFSAGTGGGYTNLAEKQNIPLSHCGYVGTSTSFSTYDTKACTRIYENDTLRGTAEVILK